MTSTRPEYPYVWAWGTCGGMRPEVGKRKGTRCRVVTRGGMNSALVEFEDGFRTITSRSGLRRAVKA